MKSISLRKGSILTATLAITAALLVFGTLHFNLIKDELQLTETRLDQRISAAVDTVERMKSEQEALGATNKIPDLRALFETTLATRIDANATSFTLSSATDKDGNTLASSTYPFIIDEGTANEEFVIADCTATACTNAARGLSVLSGTSSVTALKKSHGRGASVKITDGPILLIHNRLLQGVDTFPNLLSYTGGNKCSASSPDGAICDKLFLVNLTNQGAGTSTESSGGIAELATQIEMASSTDYGADRPLVLQAKYATSSPDVRGLYAIISTNAGYLKQAWLNLTEAFTFSGGLTSTGATTLATTTVNGKNVNPTFGGTGLDGALSASTGTTTIDFAGQKVIEKNYTSISITGSAALTFSNPHAGGSIAILKSQGDVTLTSSTSTMIELRAMGGIGGTASVSGGAANGCGGGGGSSVSNTGTAGQDGTCNSAGLDATDGTGFGVWHGGVVQTGGQGADNDAANASNDGGVSPQFLSELMAYTKALVLPGSGGGGGQGGSGADGTNGGRGGGALYIEVGGALNFTGTIDARGASSTAPTGNSGGCGGGGGGGSVQIVYNTLTANSGTINVTGGAANVTCSNDGGTGATGTSTVTKNTNF